MKLKLKNSRKMIEIDKSDYRLVRGLSLHLTQDGQVITQLSGKNVNVGRIILGPGKYITDHVDGNPLNNRRSNLRKANKFQSSQNRRGWTKKSIPFKGVHLDRKRNKYRAIVTCKGFRFQSKRFDTQIEAAHAYDRMSKKLHGEFARTNFK